MKIRHVCKNYMSTWRIIPVSKWLITMVIVSPLSGVVGPLPNGLFMAYKWGLLTNHVSKSWEPILQVTITPTAFHLWIGVFFLLGPGDIRILLGPGDNLLGPG